VNSEGVGDMSFSKQQLFEKYRKSLSDKAEKLQTLHQNNETQQLITLLHQLTGSAGMYDLSGISDAARDLHTMMEASSAPDQEIQSMAFKSAFDGLIAKMKEEHNK